MILTCDIHMKKSDSIIATANKQPLALVHDVLEVDGHLRLVLMGSQALLVQESEAAPTLVRATSVGIPNLIPSNRVKLRWAVSSSMGLTDCKDLSEFIINLIYIFIYLFIHLFILSRDKRLTSNPLVFKSSCTAHDASRSKPLILWEPNLSEVEQGLLTV